MRAYFRLMKYCPQYLLILVIFFLYCGGVLKSNIYHNQYRTANISAGGASPSACSSLSQWLLHTWDSLHWQMGKREDMTARLLSPGQGRDPGSPYPRAWYGLGVRQGDCSVGDTRRSGGQGQGELEARPGVEAWACREDLTELQGHTSLL